MEKYLPIGTVCTLDSTNRKYVIAGYFSLEYNSSVKMYDYVGIPYPEGLLLHNKMLSFNHDEILTVDFLGYSDQVYNSFNKRIVEQSNEVDSLGNDNDLLYNFSFDENGVVVYEYKLENQEEKNNLNDFSKEKSTQQNPFNKKYNFSVGNDGLKNSNEWSIFKNYEFDKNGNVVAEEVVEEPINEEFNENESNFDEKNNQNYEFDENGFLISGEE